MNSTDRAFCVCTGLVVAVILVFMTQCQACVRREDLLESGHRMVVGGECGGTWKYIGPESRGETVTSSLGKTYATK